MTCRKLLLIELSGFFDRCCRLPLAKRQVQFVNLEAVAEHFLNGLSNAPVIVVDSPESNHETGSVRAVGAMYEDRSLRWILRALFQNLEKDLLVGNRWYVIARRQIDIFNSQLAGCLRLGCNQHRIHSEIDDCFHTELFQAHQPAHPWRATAKEVRMDAMKVRQLCRLRQIVVACYLIRHFSQAEGVVAPEKDQQKQNIEDARFYPCGLMRSAGALPRLKPIFGFRRQHRNDSLQSGCYEAFILTVN